MKIRKLAKADFYVGQDVFLLQIKRCYLLRKIEDDTIRGRVDYIGRRYITVRTQDGSEYKFDIHQDFEQVSGRLSVILFIDEIDIYDWVNGGRDIPRETARIMCQLGEGVSLACLEEIQKVLDKFAQYEKEGYKV